MQKGCTKNYTSIKPLENSTMTCDESEDMHNQLSKLNNWVNELSDRSVKILVKTQRQMQKMVQKMDQNMEQME
jgi:hypothetical protein